ncbi:MAG TPA: bifunctional DNA-formamidopyrimidine glycosylase/DNA-(apurinic or apyrimidinic site) lyase [Candidatus Paceibacterota bacterium]
MPELPEVQTTVNGLNTRVRGMTITDVWTDYKSRFHRGKDNINDPKFFKKFEKAIIGAKILKAERRGKNILIHLSNGQTVLIHMKMTGHVMVGKYKKLAKKDHQGEWWRPEDPDNEALNDPFNRFIHLVFTLSDGRHVVLSDMRKFAKATVVETRALHESEHLSTHGPEPLESGFDATALRAAAMRRPKGKIKQVLMDHTVLSGVGNIYSDEILWGAAVHPLSIVSKIPEKKWNEIYSALIATLKKGIDFGGDSMSDYRDIDGKRGKFQAQHNAYRKTGERCGKRGCRGTINRIKLGGRSGHFCDTHQKLYT